MGKRAGKTRVTKCISALLSLAEELPIMDEEKIDLQWRPTKRGGSFCRPQSGVFKTLFLDDFLRSPKSLEIAPSEIGILDEQIVKEVLALDDDTIKLIATCRTSHHELKCLQYNLGSWFRLITRSLDYMIYGDDSKGYETLCEGAHMIQQCEEKIKMYEVDLPLRIDGIGFKVRPSVRIEKNQEYYTFKERIPVRKEFTDLVRHLLSEYLGIGNTDKVKKTRDRLFEFLILLESAEETSRAHEVLIHFVRAIQLKSVAQLKKSKEELERIGGDLGSDISAILVRVSILAISKWEKKASDMKSTMRVTSLERWITPHESYS
jgi:hypothetical protein